MVSLLWFERGVSHFPTKIVSVGMCCFCKQFHNCSRWMRMYFLTQNVFAHHSLPTYEKYITLTLRQARVKHFASKCIISTGIQEWLDVLWIKTKKGTKLGYPLLPRLQIVKHQSSTPTDPDTAGTHRADEVKFQCLVNTWTHERFCSGTPKPQPAKWVTPEGARRLIPSKHIVRRESVAPVSATTGLNVN